MPISLIGVPTILGKMVSAIWGVHFGVSQICTQHFGEPPICTQHFRKSQICTVPFPQIAKAFIPVLWAHRISRYVKNSMYWRFQL